MTGQGLRAIGSVLMGAGLTFLARSSGALWPVLLGLALFSVGLSLWHDGAHR